MDPFYDVPQFATSSTIQPWMLHVDACGPLATGYVVCPNGDIIVNGPSYNAVDLPNGYQLRTYSNGDQVLFHNGEYFDDVELVRMEIRDGSAEFSIDVGRDGGGFSYTANDDVTYTFEFD